MFKFLIAITFLLAIPGWDTEFCLIYRTGVYNRFQL